MKLDLKAIEERCEKAEQDTMHTMRLLAFHQKDIAALLAFAKDAKEVLEQISDLKNPTKLKYICWPKSEYMTIAREVLQRWFGEEGEK